MGGACHTERGRGSAGHRLDSPSGGQIWRTVGADGGDGQHRGATVEYAVTDAGDTGCTFGDPRTLSFTAPGLCRVTATATKEHYNDWEREHAIVVRPGVSSVTLGAFTNNDTLIVGGADKTPSAYSSLAPSDAEASWQLVRGEDDCELVDGSDGTVRALPRAFVGDESPECSIQVVAQKKNYALFKSAPVSIPLEKGDLGTLTAPVYGFGGTQLSVGGFLEMTTAPTESNGLPITFTFEVAGADSGGTPKEDVCTVDAAGRITAGEEGQGDDTCTITTTVSSLGYNDGTTAAVVLTLKGTATFATPPTFSYSDNLKIGDSTALAVDATGLDTLGNTVTWTFHTTGGVCTVVAADGQLSLAADANAGDVCTVRARGVVSGNADYITGAVEVSVDKGDLDFTNGGSNLANYTGKTLHLGGSVAPIVPAASQDDNSVAVSWGSWRVVGVDVDGGDAPQNEEVCTVSEDGVVIADGTAASPGDTCTVWAVASSDNYNDSAELELGTLTVMAQGDLTLSAPTYTDDLVVRGYAISAATAPSAAEVSELEWTYHAEGKRGGAPTENICSVDEADGTVTPGTDAQRGDTCEIVARTQSPGYNPAETTAVELTLHDTFAGISWSAFPGSAAVGTDVNLSGNSNAPTTMPVAARTAFAISIESGDCAYSNADVLSFSDLTECVVKVVASNDGAHYLDKAEYFRVTPGKGTIAVRESALAQYSGVRVGAGAVSAPSLGAVDTAGVAATYALAEDSTGCTVTTSGAVTGTANGSGNCKVVMTLSKNAYNNREYTYTISVGKGRWGSVAWAGYSGGNTATFGTAARSRLRPTSTPAADSWTYSSSNSAVCTVNSGTGALTIVGVGSCVVKAKPVKAYYQNHGGVTVTLTVNKGSQAGPISWSNPYGSDPAVAVGGSALAISGSAPERQGAINYKVKSSSTSYCSVHTTTGAVTAKVAGANQNCTIRAWYLGNANYNASPEVDIATIAVNEGTLGSVSWGSFTGTLKVGSGQKTPSTTSLAGATVRYALKSGSAANCHLRSTSTGAVEAKAVASPASKTCTIVATVSKTGYTSKTRDISVSLAAGTISGVAWTPTLAGTVGEDLTLEAVSGNVAGDTVTYSKVSGAGCSFNTGTRVASFTTNADCVVKAKVARTGYTAWNSGNKTITVSKGTLDLAWSPGVGSASTSQSPLTLPAATGDDVSTATITYRVTNADTTSCAFGSGSATLERTLSFSAAGTCTVQASATRSHYNNWSSSSYDITITTNPPVGITWAGYESGANSVAMGGTYNPDTPTYDPSGATGTYSHTGTGCSVTNSGVLTPTVAGDSCVVTLSATATNREPGSVQVTVDVVKATQSAPTASSVYGTPTLVTGGTQVVVSAPTGGHGTLSYRSATGTICTVDTGSGTITARLNGNCTIEAKWGGDATYEASAWGVVQTIAIGLGTLTITDPGSFSGNLVVGGASLSPTSPTTNPPGASFSYALKSGETDCTLDGSTGASLGTVSVANVAVTANTTACTLVVTATLNGYTPATAEVSVNLEEGVLVFSTTPAPAYAGRGFATSGTTEIGDVPASDDNSIAVTWSFAAAGTRSGSTQANVCSVDTTNIATLGDITAGSDAQDGDECTITMTATASVAGYATWSRQVTLLAGFAVVVEIAAGNDFYCARFDNGKVKCWGYNFYGTLGNGIYGHQGDNDSEMGSSLPYLSIGTDRVAGITNGRTHACAILRGGSVKCWGGE